MSDAPPNSTWGKDTVIMNRYRLESMLGQGGMGSVWRAEHLQLRSPVAIKMLDPAIANNEQMLGRFLREAQACAALRSQNVVQIFDYGVDDGTAFIAMEMLNGESLSDRIARLGRVPPEEAFRFLADVLRAIGKAHEAGIVHRDLKPDNVFICREDPEYAKVLDFGVAKVTNKDLGSSAGKTQTGMMIGTPYYMSPEQTQAKEVDHRADLWAIAVIAYECLTGQRPFSGESFGELVIAICTNPMPLPSKTAPVPPGFDEWFVRGTQRDKNRRFQSAREMADELAKLASGARQSVVGVNPSFAGGRAPLGQATAVPANSPLPIKVPVKSPAPGAHEMQLTTGSRAVVSSATTPVSSSGARPAMLVLTGIAALIVVGVVAFVAMGGAAAFRSDKADDTAAAVTPPIEAPAAVLPPPVAAPEPAAPAPAVVPISEATASAAPSASAKEATPAPEPAKATAQPAKTPAKVPPSAPKPAAPKKTDKQPPKNWEF